MYSARADFTFGSFSAIASTWLGDSLRPAGGVSEGATGIGASGLGADAEAPLESGFDAELIEAAELAA